MIWKHILLPSAAVVAAFGQATPGTTATTTRVNLSAMAASVLEHTRQARAAIGAHDKTGALGHINQALKTANEVQNAAEANGMGTKGKLMVPIYRELETESVYRPVKHGKGETMTAGRLKRDTSIREVTGRMTGTSLDVTGAREHLEAARTALNNGDFAVADSALDAVEKGVVTESANFYVPLLRARENLDLARERVLEGKYKDAKMPLLAAAQALANYQKLSPGPHAGDAGYLRARIDGYAADIAHRHGDALDRIRNWSETVDRWCAEMTR